MKADLSQIDFHLATLKVTTEIFADLALRIADSQSRIRPERDEWSLHEILAHLHACAEVWGDDIDRMLATDGTRYTKPHPRTIMKLAQHTDPSFAEASASFGSLRSHLISILQLLNAISWDRCAKINGRNHTIFTQVRRMALHEEAHRAQIEATLASIA